MRFVPATVVFAGLMFGQTAEFEVATIKPAQPIDLSGPDGKRAGLHVDGARVDLRAFPLGWTIALAWEIDHYQVSCPDWMNSTSFDIAAILPPGATKAQVPAMLRALLTERFKLTFHDESRPFSVYTLMVGNDGTKLLAAPGGAASDPHAAKYNIDASNVEHIEFSNISMPDFAKSLGAMAGRPVVDKTGLTGVYQATIEYALRSYDGSPPDLSFLFKSVRKLGLKLDSGKEPLDVLVIDHAEKTPMAN